MTRAMTATPCLLALLLSLAGIARVSAQGNTIPEAPVPMTRPDGMLPMAPPAPPKDPSRTLPSGVGEAVGNWTLAVSGGASCALTLSGDSGPNGKIVRYAPSCRKGLPALSSVGGWLFGDGAVRLVDSNIRPVLQFVESDDGRSYVASAGGRRYTLRPEEIGTAPAEAAIRGRAPDSSENTMPDLGEPRLVPGTTPIQPVPPVQSGNAPARTPPEPVANSIPDLAEPRPIPGSQPMRPDNALASPTHPIEPNGDPLDFSTKATAAVEPVSRSGPTEGVRPGFDTPPPADRLDPAPSAASPAQPGSDRPQPGTYALDRFSERDVCRIALDPRPAALASAPDTTLAPARILPGCRDSGIAVFEPVSWRFANGHMTLKAKRGHAINLVANGEGGWRRDPDTGTTLVLRKIDP